MSERVVSLHWLNPPHTHASDFFHFKISRHCCGGDWKFETKKKQQIAEKNEHLIKENSIANFEGEMKVDAKHSTLL
jgi:hypothetical protein